MFTIRVICDPADTERITTALNSAFTLDTARTYPTRDGKRTRLYLTADHRTEPGPWPTPDEAYALAPSIVSEMGWTTRTAVSVDWFAELERDYYLRKAALLDRIALLDEPTQPRDTTEVAQAAALVLLDTDRQHIERSLAKRAESDPRGYVRQEYARWIAEQ